MQEPDSYLNFKKQIGYVLVAATVLYGVLVTLLLIFFGSQMSKDQVVWGFINTIVSSMMGWLMGQASTIINNVWGTSQSSDRKTDFIMDASKEAVEKLTKNPNPKEGEVS